MPCVKSNGNGELLRGAGSVTLKMAVAGIKLLVVLMTTSSVLAEQLQPQPAGISPDDTLFYGLHAEGEPANLEDDEGEAPLLMMEQLYEMFGDGSLSTDEIVDRIVDTVPMMYFDDDYYPYGSDAKEDCEGDIESSDADDEYIPRSSGMDNIINELIAQAEQEQSQSIPNGETDVSIYKVGTWLHADNHICPRTIVMQQVSYVRYCDI